MKHSHHYVLGTLLLVFPSLVSSAEIEKGEMAGYLLVPHEKVPESYNAGFSVYAAAWPLLEKYPGRRFQTGLFGTWMHPQYEGNAPNTKCYTDIEGGLGWWRDTRFATETPKFIMGGVAPNFVEWANGPGAGKGRNWDKPAGHYGIAQLSPWLLWPPDGLNLKQGTCGELFGYGYLPLPLTEAKSTTAGYNVPTGNHCWTLFLNTQSFKGPVAFFTPYFWSRASVEKPEWAGLLLDSRPAGPNKAIQMETQYIPSVQSVNANGETIARIARTSFPKGPDGTSVVLHRLTAYDKDTLWNSVQSWFDGGASASGGIDPRGAIVHPFRSDGGATWKIYTPSVPKEQKVPLAWKSFATPFSPDPFTYGYRWQYPGLANSDSTEQKLVTLPEYFRLVKDDKKPEWVIISNTDVPRESGLTDIQFDRPAEDPPEPYVTPDEPESCWKTPGPVAGPFQAFVGDGSVVTYYWYRFADQPAMLNADLTSAERERIQARVEKLHRAWPKSKDYLAPPTTGKLADLDPALLVVPPKGLEAGYVPIATRQELDTRSIKQAR